MQDPTILDAFEQDDRELQTAGLGRRLGAAVIDLAIFAFFLVAVIYFFNGHQLGFFLMFLGHWHYYALMEMGEKRGTIGKTVLRIETVDLQGGRISYKKATIRHMARVVNILYFFGLFYILFDKKHRAVYDLMSGTMVIRSDQPEW